MGIDGGSQKHIYESWKTEDLIKAVTIDNGLKIDWGTGSHFPIRHILEN